MIRLAFRLDDPSTTSNSLVEGRILDAVAKHGLKVTFAVIPFRNISNKGAIPEIISLTRERAGEMIKAMNQGILEIAQHGYLHKRVNPVGRPSEFSGVPAALQQEHIIAGKSLLEDVFERPIYGFIPPWNSFDMATLDVLEQLSFSYISSNLEHVPQKRTCLHLLPLTCYLSEIRSAVAEARRFSRLHPVITVVMHHYDFPGGGGSPALLSYEAFDDMLAWLVEQVDVHVVTLGVVADSLRDKDSSHWIRHRQWREHLPWRFKHFLPELCIATRSHLRSLL